MEEERRLHKMVLNDIKISKEFANHRPKYEKLYNRAVEVKNGKADRICVDENGVLIDGYATYIVLKEVFGRDYVYVDVKKHNVYEGGNMLLLEGDSGWIRTYYDRKRIAEMGDVVGVNNNGTVEHAVVRAVIKYDPETFAVDKDRCCGNILYR